jgi:hypothetical protein
MVAAELVAAMPRPPLRSRKRRNGPADGQRKNTIRAQATTYFPAPYRMHVNAAMPSPQTPWPILADPLTRSIVPIVADPARRPRLSEGTGILVSMKAS